MIPASAASTAPRSELSSQGCTTRVGTAGTFCAAAIRRSYFDPSVSRSLRLASRSSLHSDPYKGTYDALAFRAERDCILLIIEPEQAGHLF